MSSNEKFTICVVGDAPNLPTGLARIARDLTGLLHGHREALGVEVIQLGYGYDGSPWPWAVYPMIQEAYWGKGSLAQVAKWLGGNVPVVFTIWDAGRCFGLLEGAPVRELWGYFPVDSENPHGQIGGPGAEIVRSYNRVLAYGGYGSKVLASTRGEDRVQWLPHGIDAGVFQPAPVEALQQLESAWPERYDWLKNLVDASQAGILVGGVATNQPRKDLALFFATAAQLRLNQYPRLSLWLHSDQENTEAWSIPELAAVYGFNNDSFILTTHEMEDGELACAYSLCHVTLAVGAGEGFGYPIVESLACGTPVIHGDFAGGAELISAPQWKVKPVAYRVAGSTALLRPVFAPEDWAEAAGDAIRWKLKDPQLVSAYCRGMVAHLNWSVLAQRWLSWFRRGIADQKAREETRAEAPAGELSNGAKGGTAGDE